MTQAEPEGPPRLPWKVPVAIFAVMVVLFAVLFTLQSMTMSALAGEDIHFNHQKHVAAGVPCVFCHTGAMSGPIAGIPSMQKCMGCHQSVVVATKRGQADVQTLVSAWEQGRALRWLKRFDQPDFVAFNHRPHIAAGVACERCHGNIGEMTIVSPPYRINMGFCLSCHRQQAPEKQQRLIDCATCHK